MKKKPIIGWFLLLLISSGVYGQEKELRLSTTGYYISRGVTEEVIGSLNMTMEHHHWKFGLGVLFPIHNYETLIGGQGEVGLRVFKSRYINTYLSSYLMAAHGSFPYALFLEPGRIEVLARNTMLGVAPGVDVEVKLSEAFSIEPGVHVFSRWSIPTPAKYKTLFLGKVSVSVKLHR